MISRTRVFKPMQDADDDVWVQLVVSLYDNVKRMTGLQKYTKVRQNYWVAFCITVISTPAFVAIIDGRDDNAIFY